MAGSLKDLQKLLDKAAEQIPDKVLSIIEVEALNSINKNFKDQGFNDAGVSKWKPRKTTDKKGRDLTRYRTNRKGRIGELTRFGQKEIGRNILIGHNTGGNKLFNSFRFRSDAKNGYVRIYTYKPYAERHNEGIDGMPKRQFMGNSQYLREQIKNKVTKELDKIFK